MYSTLHRRPLRLVTMLIIVAMLLAPTASLANCCCVLAKVGQAVGLSASGCCDLGDVASCCESPAQHAVSKPRSCCSDRTAFRTHTAFQTHTGVLTPVPTQCDCEQSCCDGVSVSTVAITSENDTQRFVQDLASDVSHWSFDSYDFSPTSSALGNDHSFRFLSAPHRCATLCRWLN